MEEPAERERRDTGRDRVQPPVVDTRDRAMCLRVGLEAQGTARGCFCGGLPTRDGPSSNGRSDTLRLPLLGPRPFLLVGVAVVASASPEPGVYMQRCKPDSVLAPSAATRATRVGDGFLVYATLIRAWNL